MLARDDMAIKDLVGITCTSADIDVTDTLYCVTVTATNWYVSELSSSSQVAGIIDIYVNGILKDELANNVFGTAKSLHSIPIKVNDGDVFSAVMVTGTSGTHTLCIEYYDFNKYGK
jgi:hypothetical protein